MDMSWVPIFIMMNNLNDDDEDDDFGAFDALGDIGTGEAIAVVAVFAAIVLAAIVIGCVVFLGGC